MIKLVLHDYPTYFGDGMTDMKWLTKLKTPELIAYFVVACESDGDLRNLDLWQVSSTGCEFSAN